MSGVALLKNTIQRDNELRDKSSDYWVREGMMMGEVMEERDVVEGVNNALENRLDMNTITRDAEAYAQIIIRPPQVSNGNI